MDDTNSLVSDNMCLDTVEEHYQSSRREPNDYQIDPLDFNTKMSLTVDAPSAETFNPDIDMAFEVNTHSVENIEGNDSEGQNTQPSLFCTSGSDSKTANLAECFRDLQLKDDSTTEGMGLDDFTELLSDEIAPSTSFVPGTSQARRIYLRALRMCKKIHRLPKNPGMRAIQDDVGSEFLFNAVVKTSEKERWDLNNNNNKNKVAKRKREISTETARRREMVKKLGGLNLS
ncbi:hypothetical protein FPOA_02437 [Fusarium poae]|uniref:Uncharacterized protein n=1 Tax=Fusarium poae TaxID=36050 RepID=A0A1B8B707_FUSPO|nr:hypothetical protein FPOA_02437 [Fusarium poae]